MSRCHWLQWTFPTRPLPCQVCSMKQTRSAHRFLLNTVNVGRLNQQRTFTDYSECCWRHSGYFAVTHMALPGISACWQITLYWLQWTFVSSCLSGCTDYSERFIAVRQRLPITVNLCRWRVQGFYWLQWTFDVMWKRRQGLLITVNISPAWHLSLLSRLFLLPGIIYWLQWIFSHRSLITVNLLLIAVNVGHRRIFASWLQWTFQQFQPPQPFSFLYLKHIG